ncbi:MAG: transglutaminase family protein [Polyangiales bacterium]
MRISVDHLTEYHYDERVSFGEHSLFLRPRESQTVHVERFELESTPMGKLRWVRDCFNNVVAVMHFGLMESETLSFQCRMAFEVAEENPFDFILEPRATNFPFAYDRREQGGLAPYLGADESDGPSLDPWVSRELGTVTQGAQTLHLLTQLNSAIHDRIAYERRDEEGVQSPEETLSRACGSCRDMAQLFVAASRHLGLASRFVSGYLYEPPSLGPGGQANRAAGSMHAWAEVYLPGAGWRGFDPTNGILTDHHFITAAVANRPQWVNPIQGEYFHAARVPSQMRVTLAIGEDAR